MTELLEQAIAKVKNLPENEQDTITASVLEELEDETKWEQAFANSHDAIAPYINLRSVRAISLRHDYAGVYTIGKRPNAIEI